MKIQYAPCHWNPWLCCWRGRTSLAARPLLGWGQFARRVASSVERSLWWWRGQAMPGWRLVMWTERRTGEDWQLQPRPRRPEPGYRDLAEAGLHSTSGVSGPHLHQASVRMNTMRHETEPGHWLRKISNIHNKPDQSMINDVHENLILIYSLTSNINLLPCLFILEHKEGHLKI